MTVETASYISQLDATLPTAGDPKSEGDNHLRLLKSVLKAQFPNFGTAAMNASVAELNYMVGVTSSVQTQLNTLTSTKAAKAGDTYTGAHNFTGGTVTVPTATAGDNSNTAASTAFATALAFASALPAQAGNSGKVVTTDGSIASWTDSLDGNFGLSGNGRRFYGAMSSFTKADRLLFSELGSGSPTLGVVPDVNIGGGAGFETYARADPDNSTYARLFSSNTPTQKSGVDVGRFGTGVLTPLVLSINGTDALQIDEVSRHIRSVGGGGIGYGVGSGGTVTQLTNKSTGVTLNKPSGQITTSNAALAANTDVSFVLTNSTIAAGDSVYLTGSSAANYQYRSGLATAGGVTIFIRNTTAGSLSDALTIDFKVLKGSLT